MDRAKPFVWRLVAASVCLLTFCHLARADSLEEQRNRYAQIKQAWDNRQMDVVEQMMPGLKDYPLYPYLEYRKITDDCCHAVCARQSYASACAYAAITLRQ